jgi:S-adenosylmethionine-diacylgycerolhomoserine-N-methlytransferase
MSGYYAWQSSFYDATRWSFLWERNRIIDDLKLGAGETVLELGCGTGRNFSRIVSRIGAAGRLIAVDCSAPMLRRCRKRIAERGWNNVELIDDEYGAAPIRAGAVDAVLLSYSLSMMRGWREALECARRELRLGGRIGVVDFCLTRRNPAVLAFSRWLACNHVTLDNPYREHLADRFCLQACATRNGLGGLWSLYRFVGVRG